MKKGEIYTGKVSSLTFPNKGTVRIGDDRIIIKNTIPGQTVSFLLSKNRPGTKEGRLIGVVEQSPLEKLEGCPVHEKCGGCIYQTLPYETELSLKEEQIRTLLGNFIREHENSAAPDWFEPIKPSPLCEAYRNKMEFSFGNEVKDGPMTLGMHVSGRFNDVIDTPDCNLVSEDMRRIRQFTIDFFRETGLPFYHRSRNEGYLRHLLLRRGIQTGELFAGLVTTSGEGWFERSDALFSEAELLAKYSEGICSLKLEGEIAGIMHIVNDGVADVIRNENCRLLYGRDFFYDEVCGLRFEITPFSFFQTNTLGAEVLYRTAAEYVKSVVPSEAGIVFDLYSGTGTISQIMAGTAAKVVGVEIISEAVEAARRNAEMNGISNVEFLAGDVLKVLEELTELPDLIIMDPPREGASPKALAKILSYGVKNIVYISCKATSLVHDLQAFYENGYRLERAVPVDMFPRTGNVESIALLERVSN